MTRKRKSAARGILAFLCAALLFLGGCGGENAASSEDQKPKDTVQVLDKYVGLAWYNSGTLNPVTDNTTINRILCEAMYEGLFEVSTTFTAVPVLCESYTGDGTTFTFTLRSDATFWSGDRVTAEDVVNSLAAARENEDSPYYARMAQVSTVEAVDSATVQIVLTAPNINFPRLLDVPVYRDSADETPFCQGTGPFRPEQENSKWYLVANENWHDGFLGQLRRLTLVSLTQASAAQSSFETGDVSILREKRISATPTTFSGSIDTVQTSSAILHYLGVNMTNETLQNAAVRRAISAALDRQGLCTTALQTFGDPAVLPVNPQPTDTSLGINAKADSAKATSELETAGLEGGPSLTLVVNSENTFKVAACEAVQRSLAAVGITVTVNELDYDSYVAALENGNFDLYYGEVQLMPDFDLRPILSGNLNYGKVSDETLLTALSAARSGEDLTGYYTQFLQDMPIIPLAFERQQIIVRKDLIPNMAPAPYNLFAGVETWESKA